MQLRFLAVSHLEEAIIEYLLAGEPQEFETQNKNIAGIGNYVVRRTNDRECQASGEEGFFSPYKIQEGLQGKLLSQVTEVSHSNLVGIHSCLRCRASEEGGDTLFCPV